MSDEQDKKQQVPPQVPELKEEDLKQVVGGAEDLFLKLDGIKGESKD